MALQVAPTAFSFGRRRLRCGQRLPETAVGPSRTDFNESYTQATGKYIVGGVLTMGVHQLRTLRGRFR